MHKRYFFETKIKKVTTILIALVIVSIGSVFFHGISHSETSTDPSVTDLQSQRDQLQKKLAGINSQIQNFQSQINSAQKQANTLKNELALFDAQIQSTQLQIQANQTQIDDTTLQITELQNEVNKRLAEIAQNKKVLADLITQLNQQDSNSFLQVGLGSNNFSDFLDQVQYNQSVQSKVYQLVQNIKLIKAKLEAQEADLKVQLSKLDQLKEQLKLTQDSLNQQRKQKQTILDQTRGIESRYQQLVVASKKEQADAQKEMDDLDASIRAKLGVRTISPGKGALAMPMNGVRTQGYGNTGFTSLGYSFHNGIDIAAPAGTPIYAAADGTVVACDTGEASYGNWCAIKHTIAEKDGSTRGIITLYGHMRTFKLKAGQTVLQGDLVGYEGNTGNTTRLLYGPEHGYHLHFSVFDTDGFGIAQGKYTSIYGPYTVPYGYTYNPLDFLN